MAGSKNRHAAEASQEEAAAPILHTLSAFLEARLLPGARLCVGFSGGVDSVVLLHALDCLRRSGLSIDLSATHVHHGLSSNADAWSGFCRDFCRDHAVPLEITRVEVPRTSAEGLEAAARRLRHAAFSASPADWLALAHHRDDQAETVLFRLLRGAGVAGAAGMPAERPQPGGPRLIRPLLDVSRSQIMRYAETHSLAWVEDESNADSHYRRNHLRREVMPRLEGHFPGAVRALARAARHFAEAAELVEELAKADRATMAGDGGRIDVARFNALSPARARNLLRSELRANGFRAPDARWLDEALRQLKTAGAAAQTCIATADGEVHVYRGELYALAQRPAAASLALSWNGESALPWGEGRVRFVERTGKGITRRMLAGARVFLRVRQGGERLRPDARRPARTLRNLLQEAAVPPWERARLPLLWCGERLAWVGGLGVDAAFACAPGEQGVELLWETGDGRPLAGYARLGKQAAGTTTP
ncbi:MAG: tRNA lysidine(34) synthetase TilS [Candidatus Accumulibacter sp.]|jgi:tRNA(Ile)-lysidine synthase|uniref:tRNA lysidine(34) synthetase TilS n=1 Tax=unclassified Candidatus Accumulibacter TaxID=2619054 RepID=UPI0012BF2AAA|nr:MULTISPECIES: tRNA lysidine(34) synthetase TilS [unclassified Candidatus Accumulibacter]MBL8367376.1 tRNA lysidine(34) synthetase TilS [Accumulibacter sp.]MQM35158.1 tRNA lysidine(34) synthetase TilS [Candidatus Accumulibacter phosphatis]HRI90121.1 tRNA lysidine(34) synthetase TilS [Accumulibacter sp.]